VKGRILWTVGCHCEEALADAAIQILGGLDFLDCFAALAMTQHVVTLIGEKISVIVVVLIV